DPRDVSLVVACVSTVERWLEFKKAWQKALPRGIAVFHTSEWAQGERGFGPYAKLTRRARRDLWRKLHYLVRRHVMLSVVEAVPGDYYRASIDRWRGKTSSVFTDPYIFCMF